MSFIIILRRGSRYRVFAVLFVPELGALDIALIGAYLGMKPDKCHSVFFS